MQAFKIVFILAILNLNFKLVAQSDTSKMFIFGHSLIDHRPPAIPTPSNETTVPHWLYLIAQEAGYNYKVAGQYGFLPQHANLPPFAQWGYDIVPPAWDSDNMDFSEANFTTSLITAGNFIQWQGPNMEYPGDPGVTPISATEDIIDWLDQQEDSIRIYIYENWPDMAPYLTNNFPPSSSDLANYNNYTLATFHDWWIEYHDSLLISRPGINVRMIPVGPIIAKLLSNTNLLDLIPITDLYEDDAPHGRPTIYFLASLITYMAIFAEPAPTSYMVPTIVHEQVQNNYQEIVNFMWAELINFNDHAGENRVFFEGLSAADIALEQQSITMYPNPTTGLFQLDGLLGTYDIDILDVNGTVFQNLNTEASILAINISMLPIGQYFIRIENRLNGSVSLQKILKID